MLNQTKTVAWIAIGVLVLVGYIAYDLYEKNSAAAALAAK